MKKMGSLFCMIDDKVPYAKNNNIKKIENDQVLLQREKDRMEKIKKLLKQQEEERYENKINSIIDNFIRIKKKFDSCNPLAYKCDIKLISEHLKKQNIILTDEQLISILEINFIIVKNLTSSKKKNYYISLRHLTPWQESYRAFGQFCCPCNNKWKSASTWKNTWQKCNKCNKCVYPYEQHKLEMSEHSQKNNLSPHDSSRCEKCIILGVSCI